jgi:hypothetical protein
MVRNVLVVLLTMLLAACGGVPKDVKPFRSDPGLVARPVAAASSGVSKVEAYTEAADRNVKAAIPLAAEPARPLLAAATQEHRAVLDETPKIKAELSQALTDKATADRIAAEAVQERDKAIQGWRDWKAANDAKWYVRWGKVIDKWVKIIAAVWLIAGVLSILAGVAPWGWAPKIGSFFVRLLPFMNPFVWVRDFLAARVTQKAGGGKP